MSQEKEELLLKRLQKSFQLLEMCVEQWETTLSELGVVVSSIDNLCEQFIHCKQAEVNSLPVAKLLPDVQERLLFKIEMEIDGKLAVLHEKLNMMKESQSKFSKHQEQCMKMYKRHSSILDVYKLTESRTTWPTLAEMLEMLSTADMLLHDLYELKIACTQEVSEGKFWDTGGLSKQWNAHNNEILQTLKDQLCHVSFFLQEKL